MKKLVTLVFIFASLLCFGQKALSGSIILQNNQEDLGLGNQIGPVKLESNYLVHRFPTFAVSFLTFKQPDKRKTKKGQKNSLKNRNRFYRFSLTGFHHAQPESVVGARDTSGNIYGYFPATAKLSGGRIGISCGIETGKKLGKSKFYVEPALTLGRQHLSMLPKVSWVHPQEYSSLNATLGSNFALHRYFKHGFLRVAALVPLLRFGREKHRIQNPLWTYRQQRDNSYFVDLAFYRRIGLEISGGLLFGNKLQ